MSDSDLKPCAILSFTPDHALTARALGALCEEAGLRVYLVDDQDKQPQDIFGQVRRDGAYPRLVVHGGGHLETRSAMDCTLADLESAWQSVCHAASLFGQEAIRQMAPAAAGTLLFLGHVGATQINAEDAAHASAQAGLRSFAQSMAREFSPKGIHVIYAKVGSEANGKLDTIMAQSLAQACWQLHHQHPSCWTHEIDLRPAHRTIAHRESWP